MKLITELYEDLEYVTEAAGSNKRTYVKGIFMQSEKKNRNGRIYPKKILENSVDKYVNEYVKNNRALGELNHPPTPMVNPERACMMIESLSWQGNDVIGRAKVLSTPMGKVLESLINDGVKIGVSSRAMGSLRESNGAKYVQDDLQLSAVDAVFDPSAHDAFVDGIMEGVEWIYENGIWKAADLDSAKRMVKQASSKELESVKIKVFETFVTNTLSNIK